MTEGPAVFPWSHAPPGGELLAEHSGTSVTDLPGDLLDRQPGRLQQFFGHAQPLVQQPGMRGCAGGCLRHAATELTGPPYAEAVLSAADVIAAITGT